MFQYILIPLLIYFLCTIPLNVRKFINNTANNVATIEFLANNFENKKALIDGFTYVNASAAGLDVLSEVGTSIHFSLANSDYIEPLADIFDKQYYDILYLDNFGRLYKYYSENIMDAIEKNYTLLESSDLPNELKGKLYLPVKL